MVMHNYRGWEGHYNTQYFGFFSVLGILSPSAGVIQYIKHFAKVLDEEVDKDYLKEWWQSNVQKMQQKRIVLFKESYASIINRQLNCSGWNVNFFIGTFQGFYR